MFDQMKVGDILAYDPGTTHKDYDKYLPDWKKCRDAIAGAKAVKDRGMVYLPPLSDAQKPAEYDKYLKGATWYGATGATLDMYTGMIMRKPPAISMNGEQVSEEDQVFFATVTTDGQSFDWMTLSTLNEVFTTNRVGILEDFTVAAALDEDGTPIQTMSQLEYEQQDKKSLSSIYLAESIINWRTDRINGIETPVLWVLKEDTEVANPDNPFDVIEGSQYRVLHLQPIYADIPMEADESEDEYKNRNEASQVAGDSPVIEWRYRQILITPILEAVTSLNVQKKKRDGGDWKVESIVYPMNDNKYMPRIPFYCISQNGVETEVRVPILQDMVEMNMGHYRNSADHEHELHMVSIKTAIFPGWDEDEYGSPMLGQALASPPGEKPFILEANGVSKLLESMKAKEERMAALGAQMLANQGRYVQSAKTAEIATAGESSIIAQVSTNISRALSEVLTFKKLWTNPGEEAEVDVSLNTDFYEERVTSEELSAWTKAVQAGQISSQVFFYNLQRLEAYPRDWTYDEEKEAIEADLAGGEDPQDLASLSERIAMLEQAANMDEVPEDEETDPMDEEEPEEEDPEE